MEEHVVVPLPTLTVTVPVGTQDPTARTEVYIAITEVYIAITLSTYTIRSTQHAALGSTKHARTVSMSLCVIYLLSVVSLVKMEERVIVHHILLPVPVRACTQDPSARSEIHKQHANNSC